MYPLDREPIIMLPPEKPLRGIDDFGSGAFCASRGNRTHRGVDYSFLPNDPVYAPSAGTILRIGYPYVGEDYKLIEMRDSTTQAIIRLFYVRPTVGPGAVVPAGKVIGFAQDISAKYGEGMTNHVHVECIVDPGYLIDACRHEGDE